MTLLHKFSTGLICTALLAGMTLVKAVAEEPINQGTAPVATDRHGAYDKLSAEDQELIDQVQRKAFDYFWDGFDPSTGLIADADQRRRTSIATSGFGLSAYCIGIDRGWVTRQEAYDRVLVTLNSYFKDPADENDFGVEGKYGLFYHFINVDTGKRHRRSEVSTIDSAILMAGVLHVMTYFEGTEVEELAGKIYRNAQWDKYTNESGAITGGWRPPEENWRVPEYRGFNEYSLVYLMGLGSPTHPLPPSAWDAYSSGNGFEWIKPYSDIGAFMTPSGRMQPHAYLYQFPACWYDFRNKKDRYANYWKVSVNALKANRRYTQDWGANVGYSEELWGWTACAGRDGYIGFSKPYNGTLAPSAVVASLPFLPEESLSSIKYMVETYGDRIWGKYGFVDSFNPHQDWYCDRFLGIDKGNEVLMIENFRTEGVWRRFMQNPFVQKGIEKAKFGPVVLAAPGLGKELLVNGDFEIGTPQDDKPDTFVCKAWRRLLWKEALPNSWLTNGKRDRPVGNDNQALEYRWGATSICQYFSATAGETYQFSVGYLNPGRPDSRWQPRIQVEWRAADNTIIGQLVTVAEADYAKVPAKTWNAIDGSAMAPANTAYGRVLLNVNNKGDGQYFTKTYIDNASVRGVPGTHNLPVSFANSPYDMALDAISESRLFDDSLANYADDKDGDSLTFTRLSGPKWLTVKPDGSMSGTPRFADAGDNQLLVKVEDGRGSSETRTLTLPVIGFLRLGNLFDDDMVLQRDAPIPVWGKAVANQPVRVLMSTGESARTTAGAAGDWAVTLPALKVTTSGSVAMSVISGTREFQLSNLLVGDVWLCSGQSNMSWPLVNTDGSREEIASAGNVKLRVVTTPDTRGSAPWADLDERAVWQSCRPEVAGDFSAVGYYFGKNLQAELAIPIGLIVSSQGGSRIESWATSLSRSRSPILYNARIHPYTRLPIKGVIWYQAEANIKDGPAYTAKMQSLVSDWRKVWGSGDFPFYFVQLAPFDYRGDAVFQLPELWAAQTAAMDLIPNSGMAVINDVGNLGNIHPTNKAPVGERLARWALHGTYDKKELVHTGPIVKEVTRAGGQLRVTFDSIGGGLVARDGQSLTWFEVAGADQVYVPATATVDGDSIVVSAPGIAEPQWVRFAWHETAEPNLMNVEGLPANSFVIEAVGTRSVP